MTISVFPRVIRDGLVVDFDPAYNTSFDSRENLFTFSEQFNTANWGKTSNVTATANATVAPDGTLTADAIVEGTTTEQQLIYQNIGTLVVGTVYTLSIYAKVSSATRNFVMTAFGEPYMVFNLSTGTLVQGSVPHTITFVGGGWYRITTTFTKSNTTGFFYFGMWNGLTSSYLGDGTSNVFVWGAQLEKSRTASPYTATTTSTITRGVTLTNTVSALYPGTINGAVAFNSDSVGSFYFNNVNADNITLPGLPATFWNAGSWSVSAWTKVNTLKSDNGIVGHGDITVNNALHLGIRGALVYFGFYGNDWASPSLINANRWYHIVWTYDNAQKQKTIFVNGVQVTQSALTGGVGYGGTGTNTSLGFYNWPSAPSSPLDGWLGRVQMYNRVLAPAEVSQIFSSLAGRHGYGI